MLDLQEIAQKLAGLEETLIYKLLDRAQYALNPEIYERGKSGFHPLEEDSLLWLRLHHQEKLEAYFGRYHIPEERPFTKPLPASGRKPAAALTPLPVKELDTVNRTRDVFAHYLEMIPELCEAKSDQQYGSSVEHDVIALQALSARIHFGAFYVAESKYLGDPQAYDRLIETGDRMALMEKLTRAEVEKKILIRIRDKVSTIQKVSSPLNRKIVDPDFFQQLFQKRVIPLTKEGEVDYLLNRIR